MLPLPLLLLSSICALLLAARGVLPLPLLLLCFSVVLLLAACGVLPLLPLLFFILVLLPPATSAPRQVSSVRRAMSATPSVISSRVECDL